LLGGDRYIPAVPATTEPTLKPGQPGSWTVSRADCVSFGGVTRSPAHVGHDTMVPLGMSVAVTSAEPDAPGARVIRAGAVVVERVAWAAWDPDEVSEATPGKPNMVQGAEPVFLNTTGTMECPAAPLAWPTEIDSPANRHCAVPAVVVVAAFAVVVVTALAVVVVALAVVVELDDVVDEQAAARQTPRRARGTSRVFIVPLYTQPLGPRRMPASAPAMSARDGAIL
jgi:hypothetical protein